MCQGYSWLGVGNSNTPWEPNPYIARLIYTGPWERKCG